MLEPLYDIILILKEWGLVSEETLPLLFLLVIFYLALHRFQFRKVFTAQREMRDKLGDVHHASLEMQKYLRRTRNDYDPMHTLDKLRWSSAHSPLDLNNNGRDLLAESGLHSIVEDNIKDLLCDLADETLDTPYDVQQSAYDVLADFLDTHKESLNMLKTFVYEHPVFEGHPVNMASLYFVGSLMLRDAYLASGEPLADAYTNRPADPPTDLDRLIA